ncbi:MAG TPA: hypothetical protein VFS89_09535 [Nitrosospira sp.]|nr:hypothetical protein [Nitrosospira sp.]
MANPRPLSKVKVATLALIWSKQADDGIAHGLAGFMGDVRQQAEAGLTLDQADEDLFVFAADEGVAFPVADTAASFNRCWALCQWPAVRNSPAALLPAGIALSALFLAAQIAP